MFNTGMYVYMFIFLTTPTGLRVESCTRQHNSRVCFVFNSLVRPTFEPLLSVSRYQNDFFLITKISL